MLNRPLLTLALFALTIFPVFAADTQTPQSIEVARIKQEILTLANTYVGQGDPDYSKQRRFDPLIAQLLAVRPQAPLSERLPLLYGAWKQAWGPYDYRNDKRGIDPSIGLDEIYQVIYPGGYYYNVTPLYPNGDHQAAPRIGLLRGEYRQDAEQVDVLRVRFTNYPGLNGRPSDQTPLIALPEKLERGQLSSDLNIVPTWVVRLFFTSGMLKEIYTDDTLRIAYGANNPRFENSSLYILTRVSLE